MVAPLNRSFEQASAEGAPASWVSTYVAGARQRANYAIKEALVTTSAGGAEYVREYYKFMWGDGYLVVVITVTMGFDEGAEAGDFYIAWADEDNHLRWDNGTGEFFLTVNGTEMATGISTTWVSTDTLEFTITNTSFETTLSLDGVGSVTEDPIGPWSEAPLYIFGTDEGVNETATVDSVEVEVAPSGFEKFFDGWPSSLDTAIESSVFALYGDGVIMSAVAYDDFEAVGGGWDTTYLTILVGPVAATYDTGGPTGEGVEDFEDAWDGTALAMTFLTEIGSSSTADFHPGGSTSESFEAGSGNGWDTGYAVQLTTPTAAVWDGAGADAAEDFEETRPASVFAVNVASDLIVDASNGVANGDTITFESAGALPGGLLAGITYYVINRSAANFQVSLTSGGAAVTITDSGNGVHQYIEDQTQYWTTVGSI